MAYLEHEQVDDAVAIEALLDRAFPDRHGKTAGRLREGNRAALALVARDEAGALIGTVRLWPVLIGRGCRALLLGPIAVEPARQGEGVGARLMRRALAEAAWGGHGAVILVGDAPYYARFGFDPALTRAMELPGPVDPARFLALELRPGALADAAGSVRADAPALRRAKRSLERKERAVRVAA